MGGEARPIEIAVDMGAHQEGTRRDTHVEERDGRSNQRDMVSNERVESVQRKRRAERERGDCARVRVFVCARFETIGGRVESGEVALHQPDGEIRSREEGERRVDASKAGGDAPCIVHHVRGDPPRSGGLGWWGCGCDVVVKRAFGSRRGGGASRRGTRGWRSCPCTCARA